VAQLHRRGHVAAQGAVEVNFLKVTELVTVTVDPEVASATTSVAERLFLHEKCISQLFTDRFPVPGGLSTM
jgi:hypothetical protein